MDEFLEDSTINIETKIALEDPTARLITVQKLIKHTFGNKYDDILNVN